MAAWQSYLNERRKWGGIIQAKAFGRLGPTAAPPSLRLMLENIALLLSIFLSYLNFIRRLKDDARHRFRDKS